MQDNTIPATVALDLPPEVGPLGLTEWLSRYWAWVRLSRPEACAEWLEEMTGVEAFALRQDFEDEPEAAADATIMWMAFAGR